MSRTIKYSIDAFKGIDQSADENSLSPSYSPDACNMDTTDGRLSVAKGYVKHIDIPVPGTGKIHRMRVFSHSGGDEFIVMAGNSVYAKKSDGWTQIYEYEGDVTGKFTCEETQISGTDYLLIGCENNRIVKYDGQTASLFGSEDGQSDKRTMYLAMFGGRLFAAGDPDYPSRLYWSQLPGSGRTIENWGPVEASVNVEGGHTEIGASHTDTITALAAMSNQLLIFTKRGLFRLIGDRPSNFTVERIDAQVERMAASSLVRVGDAAFYMTHEGLFIFNGVTSYLSPDARKICVTLDGADVSDCRGAATRRTLYFTVKEADGGDAMIEYDMLRYTYMIRRGFGIRDICAWDGRIYLVNDTRCVYRFGEGGSYDGAPIEAHWNTPLTDLLEKTFIKHLDGLYLRGSAENDAALIIDVTVGDNTARHRVLLPYSESAVKEIPLRNEGRAFKLRFSNENGGAFSLFGGVELEISARKRVS